MKNIIKIHKGHYKNFKIVNTAFPLLKPVISEKSGDSAWVDASEVLGEDFKKILVKLEDYTSLEVRN